jgi:hypothetical protein
VVKSLPDYVERRIVVEFGRQYAYLYMTTGDGKMVPNREESFRQPFRMELKEARDEADETWHMLFDHLNETINFPTASSGDEGDTPEE